MVEHKKVKLEIALFFITALLIITGACSGENEVPAPFTNVENDSTMVDDETKTTRMNIHIGDTILTVKLADNSSVDALVKALSEAPITVNMSDYGNMEKVGSLSRDFPRKDEPITTEAGDVILYQGNALVIYYAPNSWTFTRLGKIENVNGEKLKDILGDGDVTVTLSLPEN